MVKVWMIFVVMTVILQCNGIIGEPEAMARPTRPKVFSNLDELQKYLDLVRNYYSVSGKARYGKRGGDNAEISSDYRRELLNTDIGRFENNFHEEGDETKFIKHVLAQLKPTSVWRTRYS